MPVIPGGTPAVPGSGNSTYRLQDVVDFVRTIGDLSPIIDAGGYSDEPAKTIATDVMAEMIAERFNWKFNRIMVPPFYTISWQQDYATSIGNIGWLEHACIIDINNTALPKPIKWPEVVRDLERTSVAYGQPAKICWLPNDQLIQGVWPGANTTYVNPLGAVTAPSNPFINIMDASGNILVLTTFGVTGAVAPDAGANAAAGATVGDGSCVWTVMDPKAQGLRIVPIPSQTGVVWQVNVVAQARPRKFLNLQQTLDPVPDDYAQHFRTGFIAYAHRHSTNPAVQAKFEPSRMRWLQSLADARKQGDRERDDAQIVPDRNIMHEPMVTPQGAAWPYGPFGIG